jgi:hypothetical protein
VSVLNSLMLLIRYVGCHSVFINDFKVYSVSVFTDDLWIRRKIAFLTIPFVSHESIFCYRFDASVVNSLALSIRYVSCHSVFIDDIKVYSVSIFANDLWISIDIVYFFFDQI